MGIFMLVQIPPKFFAMDPSGNKSSLENVSALCKQETITWTNDHTVDRRMIRHQDPDSV